MKQFWYLAILLFACQENRKPTISPFESNKGIPIQKMLEEGWMQSWLDHGTCTYSKKDGRKEFVIYSSWNNDCKYVESQELYISLNSKPDTCIDDKFKLSEAIIKEVDSILKSYNSIRTTNYPFHFDTSFKLKSKNSLDRELLWSIVDCDSLLLVTYAD